jgi:hypothetical protein
MVTKFSKVLLATKPTFHETISVLVIGKLTNSYVYLCQDILARNLGSYLVGRQRGLVGRIKYLHYLVLLFIPWQVVIGDQAWLSIEPPSVKIILIQVYLNCFHEAVQVS